MQNRFNENVKFITSVAVLATFVGIVLNYSSCGRAYESATKSNNVADTTAFTISVSDVKSALSALSNEDGILLVERGEWFSSDWTYRKGDKYVMCRLMTRPIEYYRGSTLIMSTVEKKYELNYKEHGIEKRYVFNSMHEMNKVINKLMGR